MDRGQRAITIDEVPLEWCFQRGVKLDFRHFLDGYVVTATDVEAELKRIDHKLEPLDIVLVNTRAGSRYGFPDYVDVGIGMGREATLYLLERGIRLTGIEWGWDAPFKYMAKRFAETKDPSIVWEGHRAGMERSSRQGRSLAGCKSPHRQLPVFGREATNRVLLGRKSPGCLREYSQR
jgi:kynurenine formamidase